MKKDKGEEIAGKEADLREKYGILVKQAAINKLDFNLLLFLITLEFS